MNRLIVASLAAMILGTPLAFAENPSAAATSTWQTKTTKPTNLPERCATLDAQVDKAKAAHRVDQEAAALHTEGETLCSSNQQAAGVKYLESALKTIEALSRSMPARSVD